MKIALDDILSILEDDAGVKKEVDAGTIFARRYREIAADRRAFGGRD